MTACLVTRGDQPEMVDRIVDSLIFDDVVVWNNSLRDDKKVAGRYYATLEAKHDTVFFQDDDVVVPADTQQRLCDAHMPGVMVANWGHGENPDGYDDLPLVGVGAICDRDLPWQALERYLEEWPADDGFLYEADFIAGVLYRDFRHLYLPFDINMPVAQHPTRLVNQPWQKQLKHDMTLRARAIRDRVLVSA